MLTPQEAVRLSRAGDQLGCAAALTALLRLAAAAHVTHAQLPAARCNLAAALLALGMAAEALAAAEAAEAELVARPLGWGLKSCARGLRYRQPNFLQSAVSASAVH